MWYDCEFLWTKFKTMQTVKPIDVQTNKRKTNIIYNIELQPLNYRLLNLEMCIQYVMGLNKFCGHQNLN